MSLYCPPCEATFAGTATCPRCGGRLITPGEAFALRADPGPAAPDPIPTTAVARVGVGLVAAVGLLFALREWGSAAVAAAGHPVPEWWDTDPGRHAGYGIAAVAAAVGGLIAGAGRPVGAITGLIAGLVVAALPLAAEYRPDRGTTAAGIAAAAVCVVLATGAGVAGARVWPAAAELPRVAGGSRGSSLAGGPARGLVDDDTPPTKWFRVVIASGLVLAAVVQAGAAREVVRKNAGAIINVGNAAQAPVVCLQIAAFLVAVGAMVGGANTGAGARHGAIVGGIATAGLAYYAHRNGVPAAVEGLLSLAEYPPDLSNPSSLGLLGVTLVAACAAAGWFADQLLPPIVPKQKRIKAFG